MRMNPGCLQPVPFVGVGWAMPLRVIHSCLLILPINVPGDKRPIPDPETEVAECPIF
mgnify:CR=1 FL=1|jgi:hypothetical protein